MIRPFGEAALLVELDSPERAQAVAVALRAEPIPGVVAVVPGLASLLVELDGDPAPLVGALEGRIAVAEAAGTMGRDRRVPVVYGGEHGPDLSEVAAISGLSADEVIARHASTELRVLFLGFAPGFPYLGGLPAELQVPRLDTPRTRTPAGSVAMAGAMSGIYPAELPGGWRVIGRTPIALFDPRREPPAYLAPGDRITFEPIPAEAWDARRGAPEDWG